MYAGLITFSLKPFTTLVAMATPSPSCSSHYSGPSSLSSLLPVHTSISPSSVSDSDFPPLGAFPPFPYESTHSSDSLPSTSIPRLVLSRPWVGHHTCGHLVVPLSSALPDTESTGAFLCPMSCAPALSPFTVHQHPAPCRPILLPQYPTIGVHC